jgi:hypothetical protein
MRCGHCGKDKDPEEFNRSRKISRGRQYNYKEMRTSHRSPEEQTRYNRNAALKRLYGLTLEDYEGSSS